jgi:hypothetical protein
MCSTDHTILRTGSKSTITKQHAFFLSVWQRAMIWLELLTACSRLHEHKPEAKQTMYVS